MQGQHPQVILQSRSTRLRSLRAVGDVFRSSVEVAQRLFDRLTASPRHLLTALRPEDSMGVPQDREIDRRVIPLTRPSVSSGYIGFARLSGRENVSPVLSIGLEQ